MLAGAVGVLSVAGAGASLAAHSGSVRAMLSGLGVLVGLALCAASYLIFRGRRLGAWVVLGALVLPSALALLVTGEWRPPPLLLILAAVTLLTNWPRLR